MNECPKHCASAPNHYVVAGRITSLDAVALSLAVVGAVAAGVAGVDVAVAIGVGCSCHSGFECRPLRRWISQTTFLLYHSHEDYDPCSPSHQTKTHGQTNRPSSRKLSVVVDGTVCRSVIHTED